MDAIQCTPIVQMRTVRLRRDAHTLAIQGQEHPAGGPTVVGIQRVMVEAQLPSAPAHPAPGTVLTGQLPSWVSRIS